MPTTLPLGRSGRFDVHLSARTIVTTPRRHSPSLANPWSCDLTAFVGLFMVACFPGIGAALAWLASPSDASPKRPLQIVVLTVGVLLLWKSRSCWMSRRRAWEVGASAMAGACLALVYATAMLIAAASSDTALSIPSVMAFGAFVLHMSLAFASLDGQQERGEIIKEATAPDSWLSQGRMAACGALAIFGLALLTVVLARGSNSTIGDVHLTMNAMPASLVVLFATSAFMTSYRGSLVGALFALPWVLLALLTTSRLGLVLMSVAVALRLRWSLSLMDRVQRQRLVAGLGGGAVILMVLLAVGLQRSGNAASTALQPDDRFREWASRIGRTLRPIPGAGELFANLVGGFTPNLREPFIVASSIEDDRYQLWRDAVRKIAKDPVGTWPSRPSLSTVVEEGNAQASDYRYDYPHNMLLECALGFGVLPGALLCVGMVVLTARAIRDALFQDTFVALSGFAFLMEVIRAQFSGDMTDNIGLLTLGFVLVSRRSACGPRHA